MRPPSWTSWSCPPTACSLDSPLFAPPVPSTISEDQLPTSLVPISWASCCPSSWYRGCSLSGASSSGRTCERSPLAWSAVGVRAWPAPAEFETARPPAARLGTGLCFASAAVNLSCCCSESGEAKGCFVGRSGSAGSRGLARAGGAMWNACKDGMEAAMLSCFDERYPL